MADSTISALTTNSTPASGDLIPVVDISNSETKKMTILSLLGEYNVKHFGAVGNGTTDDTATVQAAITACETAGGGTVIFPNGTYKITSHLTVNGNYDILLKGGGTATINNANITSDDAIVVGSSTGVRDNFIEISNLIIVGNALSRDGINLIKLNNVRLNDCLITDHGRFGILGSDTYSMVIESCEVDRCGSDGIYLTSAGGNNVLVQSCKLSENAGYGVKVEGTSYNFTAMCNDFEYNETGGLYSANCHNVNVIYNYFELNTDYAVYIDTGVIGVNIIGNDFFTNGIYTISTSGIKIDGNVFEQGGIELTGTTNGIDVGYNQYPGGGSVTIPANNAQVFNTSIAVLELMSSTKGFFTPRMTTTARDAISTPTEGLLIYNTTTHALNHFNGTAWVAFVSETPVWTSFTAISSGITIGAGTSLGYYTKNGKTVHFSIAITLAATSSVTGDITLALPVAAVTRTGAMWVFMARARDGGTADYQGNATAVSAGTTIQIKSNASNTAWNATAPFTFGDADSITVTGTYEAA
jgi:hypothetical protein